jgi:hypothetical protein
MTIISNKINYRLWTDTFKRKKILSHQLIKLRSLANLNIASLGSDRITIKNEGLE